MNSRYQSETGRPYSEEKWLENHHSIKSRLRSELIQHIHLQDGQRVLDVGCGTGSWTFLAADQVGHSGSVLGIDIDQRSLDFAEAKRSSHHHRTSISLRLSDIIDLEVEEKFDVILIFNCLCYVKDPGKALKSIKNLLTPSGRLIVKDSDLGSDFFWPVDRDLYHRLLSSTELVERNSNSKYYDPFFARKIPGLLNACGFVDLRASTQSFSFVYPVDAQQRAYIAENGKMISDRSLASCVKEDVKRWQSLFDENSKQCIFEKKEFIYSMSEFIFQARVPSTS